MITAEYYWQARYQTNSGFDGVVRISYAISSQYAYKGSGALLYDGSAVLTAAHLFYGSAGSIEIEFITSEGVYSYAPSQILIDPNYDPGNGNNDLALIFLERPAPLEAERFQLYRDQDEVGQDVSLVGFGSIGSGSSGATSNPDHLHLQALNTIDLTDVEFNRALSTSWTPQEMLFADFDSGQTAHDALGQLVSRVHLGTGESEGMIAQVDSGGPAFLDGQLVGVASYTSAISNSRYHPDIDDVINSSFGEVGAWQRISAHQEWIDSEIRSRYENAPTRASEVNLSPEEAANYTYFMVEFNGVRYGDSIISVDYATRDGTASAGEDYLAAEGRLNIYPNEGYALILVELINDSSSEVDETFYLDIFNPIGGSFGGVEKLTAMRTIVDDDLWLG